MVYWDEQGNTVEISKADQLWLDDGYFKTQQAHLPPDAPRAALSYRVSTKGQVDHNDIPMQKIKCRKFAQQQGWRVVMEKAEKGISGSKVSASKRDVIQELRQEAGNGSFDILLVYMFDRLGSAPATAFGRSCPAGILPVGSCRMDTGLSIRAG